MRRPVVLATVALGALLTLWSLAVPAYRTPDEPQHLSTTLRLATGGGYPPAGSGRLLPEVAASYPYADFPGGDERTFVRPRKVTRPDRHWPSFAALAHAPVPADQVGQADQMTQHPPLWNLLAAAEVDLLGLRDAPAGLALVVLRLLQAALLLPLPWLCRRTARLLGAPGRGADTAAFLPLLAPQFLHIGASVSDGTLLVLEFAAATPALVRVARGDRRARTALLLAVLTGLALLTKAFGAVLLVAVALAYVVGGRPRRGVLAIGGALAIGGWWYAAQKVNTGAFQPSGYPPGLTRLFAGDMSFGTAQGRFWRMLADTTWCDLGWFETPTPLTVVLPALAVVAVPVTWAVATGRVDRRAATVVLTPFVLLVPLLAVESWLSWRDLGAVYGAQGRYLFPAVTGVAGVFGVVSRPVVRLALPLGCLVAQGLGLLLAVEHFWAGGLGTASAASPLPTAVWGVAAAVAVLALLLAAVPARRPTERPPAGARSGSRNGTDQLRDSVRGPAGVAT